MVNIRLFLWPIPRLFYPTKIQKNPEITKLWSGKIKEMCFFLGSLTNNSYICTVKSKDQYMSKETVIQQIAHYFETQPVLKAWLFGSFARDEQTEDSDVDILIVLDHSQPIGLKFFGMWGDLERMLGRPVDLVVDRSLAPYARESADRDKKLIYERTA